MSSSADATKLAILESAQQLFQKGGAGDVRVEDVARAAGVSRQSVYLHFGSRTGLLLATAQHVDGIGRLGALLEPVVGAPDPVTALDALVTVQAEYNPDVYPLIRALLASRYTDAAAWAAWDNRMEGRRQALHGIVEWLQRDGVLAPGWSVDAASDVLWTLTSPQTWEQLVIERQWPKERYVEHVRRMLHDTLVAPER